MVPACGFEPQFRDFRGRSPTVKRHRNWLGKNDSNVHLNRFKACNVTVTPSPNRKFARLDFNLHGAGGVSSACITTLTTPDAVYIIQQKIGPES